MSLALAVRKAALAPGKWVSFPSALWRRAKAAPSLDLRFADNKSLVDAVTGQSLVTFTRASSGTYVGSDGLIKTATTDAPRFDHNPTTGESLGLLVEESRTNLTLRSEEFNDTYWTKNFSSVTANAIAAPDGTTTADLLVEDGTTSVHEIVTPSISFTLNATYALSVFVKAGTRSAFRIVRSGPGGASATFDLLTLTAAGIAGSPTVSIVAYNSNWYRCTMSWVASATASRTHAIRLDNPAGTESYTGNGTSGLYIWGAQLEAGAFPTSYIRTTTATVTRSADVASITGTNFSSWYRQDEGTVFADARHFRNFDGTNRFPRLLSINDGSGTANSIELIYALQSGNLTTAVPSIRVDNILQASPAITGEQNGKAQVLAYALNNVNAASGGTLSTQDNSAAIPTVNQALIGYVSSSSDTLNGHIRRLTYWPQRLSNTTLQAVTQ